MEQVVVAASQVVHEVAAGQRQRVGARHVAPIRGEGHPLVVEGEGEAREILQRRTQPERLQQLGHDRGPIAEDDAVDGVVGEIGRCAGRVDPTHDGPHPGVPALGRTAELDDLVDPGDVRAGADDVGAELAQAPLEPALEDHVHDLDLVAIQSRGHVLQLQRLADHDVLQPRGMGRDGGPYQEHSHQTIPGVMPRRMWPR